ncbi:MAG: beta-carotene hydroxylase [Pseudomonadota bacterium]
MSWITIFLTIVLATIATEVFAWWLHRHVMHGWAWKWHKSHHEKHDDHFELNDAFSLIFAALAIALLVAGQIGPLWEPVFWAGIGVCVYGALYVFVHEILTHRRLPIRWQPKSGYLKRLVDAHHLHHVSRRPDVGVSFGFLYTPPVHVLRKRLKKIARSELQDTQ